MKVIVCGILGGNNAHEKFLETTGGILNFAVSVEQAEELWDTEVESDDFGGFSELI